MGQGLGLEARTDERIFRVLLEEEVDRRHEVSFEGCVGDRDHPLHGGKALAPPSHDDDREVREIGPEEANQRGGASAGDLVAQNEESAVALVEDFSDQITEGGRAVESRGANLSAVSELALEELAGA